MIDIQQQEDMFVALGKVLKKRIHVYAIGGTAMMLQGIKNTTVDVDFVFNTKEERIEVMDALRKLGAKESDVTIVYGLKTNTPLMLEFNKCRFDMFLHKIITSTFSEGMKKRATETHEFGNLIIKVADPLDILIMKSATSRDKDTDDICTILNKKSHIIQWDNIVEEAQEQVKLGNEVAIMNLGKRLEALTNKGLITLPQGILDALWKTFTTQVKKKKKKQL